MLRIVVMGLGHFGYAFARRLAEQPDVEILAMDRDQDRVDDIAEHVRNAVMADCTQCEILEELDVASADYIVISLGSQMDASILATLHARSLGAKNIYVKAISEEHERILDMIGATKTVQPEKEVATSLAEALGRPNVLDYVPLGEKYSIIEMEPSSKIVGKSLEELDLRNQFGVTVIGVKEYLTGEWRMNPPATYSLADDVSLLIIGKTDQIEQLQRKVGR